jgi:hypothetical protein
MRNAMSDGIDRLRRAVEVEGGLTPYRPDQPAENPARHRLAVDWDFDTRYPSHRCGICLRGIDPRRKHKVTEVEFACGTCWELRNEQKGPEVYLHWLGISHEHRRYRLAQHFGIDPVTRTEALTEVDWIRAPVDADGLPITVEVERSVGRLLTVGIPRCYWSIARERGWL